MADSKVCRVLHLPGLMRLSLELLLMQAFILSNSQKLAARSGN